MKIGRLTILKFKDGEVIKPVPNSTSFMMRVGAADLSGRQYTAVAFNSYEYLSMVEELGYYPGGIALSETERVGYRRDAHINPETGEEVRSWYQRLETGAPYTLFKVKEDGVQEQVVTLSDLMAQKDVGRSSTAGKPVAETQEESESTSVEADEPSESDLPF